MDSIPGEEREKLSASEKRMAESLGLEKRTLSEEREKVAESEKKISESGKPG